MKIEIKLKHTELHSLVQAFEQVLKTEECTNRYETIIAILLVKFYKKLKEKCIILEPRNYKFSVGPETAIAFVEYFSTSPFSPTSHAGNLIQQLIFTFDQQTASFIK
jgi:hypothetical protein